MGSDGGFEEGDTSGWTWRSLDEWMMCGNVTILRPFFHSSTFLKLGFILCLIACHHLWVFFFSF